MQGDMSFVADGLLPYKPFEVPHHRLSMPTIWQAARLKNIQHLVSESTS
jgi:hypothetical protein